VSTPSWDKPSIVKVGALPAALGGCATGSTQTPGSCAAGNNANQSGDNCKNGFTPFSACGVGSGK